ncbi:MULTISPECIES: hypothetical protein [unclassified Frankia]|uniref:hypothetical protein n=1 Tax=unclassified Frankia TaxID=2632575 RepID=UPI000FF893BE|nr:MULTISPECIES: hypothetical protein [unclassified Frankia]
MFAVEEFLRLVLAEWRESDPVKDVCVEFGFADGNVWPPGTRGTDADDDQPEEMAGEPVVAIRLTPTS